MGSVLRLLEVSIFVRMVHVLLLLAGLPAFSLGLVDVTDPCPFWSRAVHVEDKCYQAFMYMATYAEAKNYCPQQGLGARLAEMMTQEQDTAMRSLAKSLDFAFLWVDAVYKHTDKTFHWASSGTPLNQSLWCSGEPNNFTHSEECAAASHSGLVDLPCQDQTLRTLVVCERDERPIFNPCYFWPSSVYLNDKCWNMFTSPSTWSDALNFCRHQVPGGTLAELGGDQDRLTVSSFLHNTGTQETWIGYSDHMTKGLFLWASSNSSTPTPNATWWMTYNPNSPMPTCVVVNSGTPVGRLRNLPCSETKNFTCQQDVPNLCDEFMPQGAVYFQGRCFLFVKDRENWDTSQTKCREFGGYLTEAITPELQDFVSKLVNRNTAEQVWTGGYINGSGLRWASTGDLARNISLSGSSNSSLGSNLNINNCWLQMDGRSREWKCTSEKKERFSVCERDIGDPCESYLPGSVYGWGQCFKYFDISVTWDTAQAFCQEMGGYLAELATSDLSTTVNTYLQALHVPVAWIGGRRGREHGLQWASGEHNVTFTLLDDSTSSAAPETYLAVIDARSWSLHSSEAVHPFVCQRGITSEPPTYRSVVAPFPQLHNIHDLEGSLVVSSNVLSQKVLIQISTCTGQQQELWTLHALEPREVFNHTFDPRQLMASSGVHQGCVQVNSSGPVTAILYILSPSKNMAASTLLLPSDILQSNQTPAAFFLAFSCKKECAGHVMTATSLDGPAEVNVLFPKASQTDHVLLVEGITYSQITQMTAAVAKLNSLYVNTDMDLDGSYLSSNHKLAVLVGGYGAPGGDFTLDQVLPVEFISNEYITFPSLEPGMAESVTVMAVESHTEVELYDAHPGGSNRKFPLEKAGDVMEIALDSSGFFHLRATHPFYAFMSSTRPDGSARCLTSLLPWGLWKHQYHLRVTSGLPNFTVKVAVIVSQYLTSQLTLGVGNIYPNCSDIQGTAMAGCVYHLPSDTRAFYHLHVNGFFQRLGAYMIASSATSVTCHAAGVRDNPQPTYVFNRDKYRQSVDDPGLCQESTTSVYVDTTFGDSLSTAEINNNNNITNQTLLSTTTASFPEVSEDIVVNVKETSAYRRSKISVPDYRASSVTIGSVGIVFIVVVLGTIVMADCIHVCQFLDIMKQ